MIIVGSITARLDLDFGPIIVQCIPIPPSIALDEDDAVPEMKPMELASPAAWIDGDTRSTAVASAVALRILLGARLHSPPNKYAPPNRDRYSTLLSVFLQSFPNALKHAGTRTLCY